MKRNNKKKNIIHLTDHITYQIIENIIYLIEGEHSSRQELQSALKKVILLIKDKDIYSINISAKNMENNKKYYMDLGFTLSYYSVDKLNELFKGFTDKKDYRCYAIMTKKDFLNMNIKKESTIKESKNENNSNKGFINSMLLLFTGIIILCYLCIELAMIIIKLGR